MSSVFTLIRVELQIWQIADRENRGLLTPAGFGIVLRLIGYAQAGRPVSAELALKREWTLQGDGENDVNLASSKRVDRCQNSMELQLLLRQRPHNSLYRRKTAVAPSECHH